jgi:hypothetical protein
MLCGETGRRGFFILGPCPRFKVALKPEDVSISREQPTSQNLTIQLISTTTIRYCTHLSLDNQRDVDFRASGMSPFANYDSFYPLRRVANGGLQVVIDAKGHLLGRLASIVAKQILNGQKVVVVRSEALNISGEFFRAKRTSSPKPKHTTHEHMTIENSRQRLTRGSYSKVLCVHAQSYSLQSQTWRYDARKINWQRLTNKVPFTFALPQKSSSEPSAAWFHTRLLAVQLH